MFFVNPGRGSFQFSQRRNALAFWFGSAVVSVGVVLHLPMFWMARNSGFNMSGMPMDAGMLLGMLLIIIGIAAAGCDPECVPVISVTGRAGRERLPCCLRSHQSRAKLHSSVGA